MSREVLLLGASVRSLAFSVLDGGDRPIGVDLFADQDLAQVADVARLPVEDYPNGFFELASKHCGLPWMYTGGLENYPDLLDRLSDNGPLWGNGGDAAAACRDLSRLATVAAECGISCPAVIATGSELPSSGNWLEKPRRGSGGIGIRHYAGGAVAENYYLQESVAGDSVSAVFLAFDTGCVLVGLTWQLVGAPFGSPPPFAYSGSIGPAALGDEIENQIARLGIMLAAEFGLLGIFGVDLAIDGESVWLIEVNPRWTASIEVLERASGMTLYPLHRAIFDSPAAAAERIGSMSFPVGDWFKSGWPVDCVGKAIVFAPEAVSIPQTFSVFGELTGPRAVRPIADIPWPGTAIERHHPVVSLFARGETPAQCYEMLRGASVRVLHELSNATI